MKKTFSILLIALALTSCKKKSSPVPDTSSTSTTPVVQDPTSFMQTIVSGSQFTARRWHRTAVFNSKIWLVGGEDNSSSTLGDLWNSADGITWSQTTPTGVFPSSVAGCAMLVYNSKLWIIGGFSAGPTSTNNIYNSTDGLNWSQLANTGTKFSARHIFAATVYNNEMWVIGGVTNGGSAGLTDIWSSSDGINWTQHTPSGAFFNGRFHQQIAVLNNKLFLIGGYDSGSAYSDVWSTTDGINWAKEVNSGVFFSNRFSHQVVVNGNTMYVIGGGITTGAGWTDEIWKSTNGSTFTQVTMSSSFGIRRDFQALVFNNKVCIIGGYGGVGSYLNDIWMSN